MFSSQPNMVTKEIKIINKKTQEEVNLIKEEEDEE